MGLQSETSFKPEVFGINIICIWLMFLDSRPDLKNFWISSVTFGPTAAQFSRKKMDKKPSGLGALSGWIEKGVLYFYDCRHSIQTRANLS